MWFHRLWVFAFVHQGVSAKLPTPLFACIWPPAHVPTVTIVLKCISDEFRKEALKAIHASSRCARLSLIQGKVLFMTAKINFLNCPKLFSYWRCCFKSMSDIWHSSPHVAILGVPPVELRATTIQNVLAIAFLVARKKILLLWKSSRPPSFKARLQDVKNS